MSEIYPWIGFKEKKDRDKLKRWIFTEYKKQSPSVTGKNGTRNLNDSEIKNILSVENLPSGDITCNIVSDLIKIPSRMYWFSFCGWWEILENIENILVKEYKNYIYIAK